MIKISKEDMGRKVVRAMPEDAHEDGSFYVYKTGNVVGFNDYFIYVHFIGSGKDDYMACVASWLHWADECKFVESKLYLGEVRHG